MMREARQEEVLDLRRRSRHPSGHAAVTGSHRSRRPKMTIRTIAETNSGTAVSERASDRDRPVGHAAPPQRREDAAKDPERDDDDECLGCELEGVDERRPQQIPHGHLILERLAHVAVEEVPDPVRVLDRGSAGRPPAGDSGDRPDADLRTAPEPGRPTSPGSTCASAKTVIDRRTSVRSPSPSRRMMKRASGGNSGSPGASASRLPPQTASLAGDGPPQPGRCPAVVVHPSASGSTTPASVRRGTPCSGRSGHRETPRSREASASPA